jgi:type I restriction enzyme M protein
VDAVIGLPLNIFYGAGVPACLLILNKNRPAERQGKVLFLYAARHFRELSNKNQLRPQDVMRLLVHYHAYGDAEHAAQLVESHAKRLRDVVTQTEHEDSERTRAEYSEWAEKLAEAQRQIAAVDEQIVGITSHMSTHVAVASSDGAQSTLNGTAPASLFPALSAAKPAKAIKATRKSKPEFDRISLEKTRAKLQKACEAPAKKIAERDERLASIAKRAEEDRQAIHATGEELRALYADPAELAKHTRVVEMSEIEENEHNLNIPRYVDTFEPEEPIDVNVALRDLEAAETARRQAESCLRLLLSEVGYALDAIA